MAQTRTFIHVAMLPLLHRSAPVIFPKCKLNSAKNTLSKWYYIGLPRLKGGFNGLRRLSNSQVIPLQIPIALHQTGRKAVIAEKQYQIINKKTPTSFFYKY